MLAPDPADLILVALPRRPSFAGGRPSSAGGNGWLPDFGRNSRSKRGSAECIDPLDVRRDGKTEECCTSKGLLIDGGGGRKSSSVAPSYRASPEKNNNDPLRDIRVRDSVAIDSSPI